MVVGGSQGLTGALIMAATAALRSGTGLVTAATWAENYGELASRIIPEIMTSTIPLEEKEIEEERLYYLSPGRESIRVVADGFVRPNGLIGTPDGSTLYVADIGDKKTYKFTINDDSGRANFTTIVTR